MKRIGILTLLIFAGLSAAAQNPVVPFRTPRATFTNSTGQPLSGGCIFTYLGGTTTPQATYTDFNGGTSNPNPVVLDSTGSATMWLGASSYKFVAYSPGGTNCASGSLQWTVDQVPGDEFLNGTISGATITNPSITGGTESGTTLNNVVITNSTINSTTIGATAPASGSFTSIQGKIDALSFSATPVFPAGGYSTFTMTLTTDVTSSTITGSGLGQVINFSICQDGTGGHTFVWPANFYNAPVMPSNASTCMTPSFFYDGANWNLLDYTGLSSAASYQNVAFSATPTFAVNPYYIFDLTLTNNVTGSTITGANLGQVISFSLCQDGTGGRAFVWPGTVLNGPLMPQAANACITPQFFYNGVAWALLGQTTANGINALTFSATPAFDASGYNQFSIALGGNVSSSTLTGGTFGQLINLNICQNATGGYTFVWPTNLIGAPTVASTASACTNDLAAYNGANWITVATTSNGSSAGSNVNGYWVIDATGTITERGSITLTNGSGTSQTGSISFPLTFPTALDSLVLSASGQPDGANDSQSVYSTSPTTSGATAVLRCSVNIGGSGCSSISGVVTIYWIAIGR